MSQLNVDTSRQIPAGDDFAYRLSGNYARPLIDVKLRQTRHHDMISRAPIDDQ